MGQQKRKYRLVVIVEYWFAVTLLLSLTLSKGSSQEDVKFNRTLVGVSFSPYVKNWEGSDMPGRTSYSTSDIQIMLRLIHVRFSKLVTRGIGAEGPLEIPPAEALVPNATALFNQRNKLESDPITIIQGLNTLHPTTELQELEIYNALNASLVANQIFPGTVTGIVLPENEEILRKLLQNKLENPENWAGLKLGAKITNCTDETESLKVHAQNCDFIMCSIFPDPICNTTSWGAENVIEQFNSSELLLKSINPKLEVMIGETGWPSFGADENRCTLANLKDYWELLGAWAELSNVTVYMYEAIDQPWRSDPRITSKDAPNGLYGIWGHFGWWKRTDSYNNNPNSYIEKIVELPKFTGGIDDDETSPGKIAVFVCVPIISLLIIGGLIVYLYRKKLEREALLRLKLSDDEIKEFEQGATGQTLLNEPWNFPYQKEFEIPKEELRINKSIVLGSGAFGIVYRGSVHKGQQDVAIKTVKNGSAAKELRNLLSEIKIMIYIGGHENIVTLIGAQTSDLKDGSVFLAAEFCSLGSLEKFLRTHPFFNPNSKYINLPEQGNGGIYENNPSQVCISMGNGGGSGELDVRYVNAPMHAVNDDRSSRNIVLTLSDLINWSGQIANGMEYLGTKHVIHADLATRNVLLTKDRVAKITDFGLSRKLYEYTQYVKKNQEPLPWRWMSLESLRNMTFSSQSDVWSFGITLWEIFSLGGIPYAGLAWDITFFEELDNGLRLNQPRLADVEIFEMMLQTWEANPANRPTFATLKTFFMQKLEKLTNENGL